jgi:hypothetical protein
VPGYVIFYTVLESRLFESSTVFVVFYRTLDLFQGHQSRSKDRHRGWVSLETEVVLFNESESLKPASAQGLAGATCCRLRGQSKILLQNLFMSAPSVEKKREETSKFFHPTQGRRAEERRREERPAK